MEEGEHGDKWHEEAFVLKVSLGEPSSWVLLSPCCLPGCPFLVKSLALGKKKCHFGSWAEDGLNRVRRFRRKEMVNIVVFFF